MTDREAGDWTGTYSYLGVASQTPTEVHEIWVRAHDNGVSFGFTL